MRKKEPQLIISCAEAKGFRAWSKIRQTLQYDTFTTKTQAIKIKRGYMGVCICKT